ncbi:MAG: adhesin transport system membrane fusion protein [Planctomycetota bacterium]|jgi:adhesin transport system membrane fusion protein
MPLSPAPLPLTALRKLPAQRGLLRIALSLAAVFILLSGALLVVPWLQNVSGSGRVTALDPLDRIQMIPAPVTGRLVELHVKEGSFVRAGEVLAEMADQDPNYAARLDQQFELTRDEVRAAQDTVQFYNQQLVYMEDEREQAISSATFALNVAIDKVRAEEQELEALEADLDQKQADWQRKTNLWAEGVVSELDFQKAEANYLGAKAKVEAAKAKVRQARNEEKAKMAQVSQVAASQRGKIESTKSAREGARSKVAMTGKKLTEATTKVERQKTQVITAPRDGYVLRVHAASSADLLSQGDPLIELIPDTDALAVEIWVRGVDAPLITPGRPARVQFEGWPAVQFAGWPSVAVGTFGGIVHVVDAQGRADGRFRVLVVPDPDDAPWPEKPYLRQGGRANGWLLLDTVKLGYEFWRQLNAFPPSVDQKPEPNGIESGPSSTKSKSKSSGAAK